MRITQQMIMTSSASNLSSALGRVYDLQKQLSSGKRLLQPSDDPIGVPRALSYRTSVATISQYIENAGWADSRLSMIEEALNDSNALIVRVREIATAMSNDDFDATARQVAAIELRGIFDQFMQLGNTQKQGRYFFSGHMTQTQAFVASTTGVSYEGDQGLIYSQVETNTRIAVNAIGSDLLLAPVQTLGTDADLNRGLALTDLLADLNLGSGVAITGGSDLIISDVNAGISVTVDLSGATTIGDVRNAITSQLIAGGINGVVASLSDVGGALKFDVADVNTITYATKLSTLNSGAGLDLTPGTFHLRNDAGAIDVTVDLSGTSSVGDLITKFDSQLDAYAGSMGIPELANISLDINAAGTGLRLIDGNGTPMGLRVDDDPPNGTAASMGFFGYVNGELDGGPLRPLRTINITEGGAGQTTAADLGILGQFSRTLIGQDLDPILTVDTALVNLNDRLGFTPGNLRVVQGLDTVVLDLSTALTVGDVINRINNSGLALNASINASGRGIQIVPTDTTKSLVISDGDATKTASSLGIDGSSDMMGGILVLIDALERNDGRSAGRLIGLIEKATDHMLDKRAAIGARARRVQTTVRQLEDINLLMTGLLSSVEDADVVEVSTQLATQQNIYQAALNAVARALAPSLSDFVR